jgi:hypothetical protein
MNADFFLGGSYVICLFPQFRRNFGRKVDKYIHKYFYFNIIFFSHRDEVTGEWRKLHNKELYALYS